MSPLARRILRSRSAMRAVIVVERAWPLLVPPLCVAALFVSLAWFGYFHAVPVWARMITLLALAAGFVWSLVGLRTFRMPGAAAVDRRLERVNRLEHQALAVQDDRPTSDSAFASALWAEHRRRMAERLSSLRTGAPEPDTPRRDPYGLRALVLLLFVTAFAYSHSNQAGFLSDAFSLAGPGARAAPVRVDAWVTPPAYTGMAPIFLTRAEGNADECVSMPAGSEVTVRVSGGTGPEVTYRGENGKEAQAIEPSTGAKGAAKQADTDADTNADVGGDAASARAYAFKPSAGGVLSVSSGAGTRAWTFDVIPDEAPQIAFAGKPTTDRNGALQLSYTVKDDYAVQSATAEIVPADAEPGAKSLYGPPAFPLSLPGRGSKDGKSTSSKDLSEHPLSGQKVKITLVATDGAGQKGRSKTIVTRLPQKFFGNPLARSVVEQRRTFALDTRRMPRALALADAITTAPEKTFDDPSEFLVMRSARERMALANDDKTMRDVADYLWQVALDLENGDLSLAQQRMRNAAEKLSQALKNGASDQEIDRLMKELRQAMNDVMQEMAKRAMQNPETAQQMPQDMQNVLRQQDLERMMDQLDNLAKSGQRDQAQQLLSQLQNMMNNLQAARPQPGQQGQNPMRQQMDKLGKLLQQQQQLMDQTFDLNRQLQNGMNRQGQQQQGQPQPGQQGQPGEQGQPGQQSQQGQNGQGQQPMTEEQLRQALKELKRQQQNLQQQLGQIQKGMEGMGMKPNKGFGKAGEAMGNASGALGKGEGDRALGEQGNAMQALRDGAQSMMRQMQQAMGRGQGQGQGPGQPQGQRVGRDEGLDPLGRPRSSAGPDFGDQVDVPDDIDIQRAREILNEIRKRLGDALSPQLEQQYLERLLNMQQ
ncbi:TIGR02302 family protein [Pararhizobium mangrovi]|uniref:TIGR02302 family protein n=2 Tax=Pararhizobium mangrovi TaxID=2590452 RepID=A0A506U1F7_9HYPH|nr:TIGR02302 family protein [Pararhizobium mangrovi]